MNMNKNDLGKWADIIEYICNNDKDLLYLGIISKKMNLYYSCLYNNIMELERLGLIKTKKIGNIRKVIEITDDCYKLSENIKKIKEVFNNAIKTKNKKSSTNR